MIANVYVVPPKSSASRRVHTTCAPSAVIPERPATRYTARAAPRPRAGSSAGAAAYLSRAGATRRATAPIAKLSVAATPVATITSHLGSR
jgi:hypothetical protein